MNLEFLEFGFNKCLYSKNRISIADSFTDSNRCGIYILHFQNNEYYVGQASNLVRRYAEHCQSFSDIEYISFKEVPSNNLNLIEKEMIYKLEIQGKSLRNISLVSIIKGETDLDLIVSPELQLKWTNYELKNDTLETPRFNYPELRKKYTSRFNKLKSNKYYTHICEILQNYILYTIPYPRKTEFSFWSSSCIPSTNKGYVFARINLFWQETLNIHEAEYLDTNKEPVKELEVSVFLCKSKLFEATSKEALEKEYPLIFFSDLKYETGGQDQQNVLIDAKSFLDFLYNPFVSDAIKEFNLRLLRKGGCNNNRYHCFDLADEILRTDNIDFD